MKIVLDTNALISGIFWKGTPYKILELWEEGEVNLVVTKKIIKEYSEVLKRIDKKNKVQQGWMKYIKEKCLCVEDKELVAESRDVDDNMF